MEARVDARPAPDLAPAAAPAGLLRAAPCGRRREPAGHDRAGLRPDRQPGLGPAGHRARDPVLRRPDGPLSIRCWRRSGSGSPWSTSCSSSGSPGDRRMRAPRGDARAGKARQPVDHRHPIDRDAEGDRLRGRVPEPLGPGPGADPERAAPEADPAPAARPCPVGPRGAQPWRRSSASRRPARHATG